MLKVFNAANRDGKTKMVNDIVKREADGSYSINTTSHVYKEMNMRFQNKTTSEKDKAVILEVAQIPCEAATQLQQAVDAGRVKVKRQGGMDWYIFKEFQSDTTEGTSERFIVSGTNDKLTKNQQKAMAVVLRKLGWKSH